MEGSDDVGSPGANGNAQGGGREGRKSSRWWRRSTAKSSDESVRPKEESGNGKAAKPRPEPVSIRKLYSFADRLDYVLMLFGCFGCIVHGATVPFMVLIYGKMLNDLGSGFSAYEINKNALNWVLVGIVSFASSWLEASIWMHTGNRQSATLRAKYLHALLRQDVAYFDTDSSTGEIIESLASDTIMVQDAISEKTGNVLNYLATFVVSFVIAFSTEWRIALVTLAVIPSIALTGVIYAHFLTRFTTEASSAYAEAGSIAQQVISQVRTVHSFVAEKTFAKTYSDALRRTLNLAIKSALVKGIGLGVTVLTIYCSEAVLFTYSGSLVRKGEANGGAVLATILIVIFGSSALSQAMSSITPFAKAKVSAAKIFQVIHHEPTINKPDKSAETLEMVDGHIELRNVDFSYPSRPDVSIFENFSLAIPPGKSVAIVGSSGSGKSTVVALIERFYDPVAGEVLLDGVDLKRLDLKWLRRQIGLVNQEPALFATTIGANIVYGSETASQKEIEEAAEVANAHSFISKLPNGYETQVGERGVQLSGGQRQRIAIARAIVKNPRVLLLDEATSALDAVSEQVVQEALDRIMVGRTTVIVAHRLSTIRDANTIAVVEQGRIVETGTHQDLVSKEGGVYSTLVHLQELATTNDAIFEEASFPTSVNDSPLRPSSVSPHPGGLPPFRGRSSPFRTLARKSMGSVFSEEEYSTQQLPEQPEKKSVEAAPKGLIKRLIAMTKQDWKYGAAAMIGSMGSAVLAPLLALLLANMVIQYYNTNHRSMKKEIAKLSWFFFAIGVFAVVSYTVQHFSLGVIGERLVNRVREKMFTNILRNELAWFDEADNNSSQLAGRLASDAATVRAVIGDRVSVVLQNVTMLVISFTISFYMQWQLALVMGTVLPLVTSAKVIENWMLHSFFKDQAKSYDRATRLAGEAVGNIRTVAAFSAEDKVQALFTRELDGPLEKSFRKGHVFGFGYGVSQFILHATNATGLWYSGHLVVTGQGTFKVVLKVFMILVFSGYMAAEALTLVPDLIKGGQAVASLFQIMDRVTKINPDDPNGKKPEKIRGDIELKELTMAYPSRPDVIVLKRMNLKVMSGRSLALVGASGSGKSSIISLIERFYDPLSGAVLIDGKDIKQYNLQFLRQQIALVQQEPALFATTIYENIVYGKEGATEAEVIEAAKAANAHSFISSLPEGYKTLVGERGVKLSGGQKQRVAIARAVLKDPTIFLLDEATSALDAESEKIVQEAIDRLMTGRTTVIVAHRLSTIRGADSIAVVQDGNIVEQGSHKALLSQRGPYSRLIRLQRAHGNPAALNESIETDTQ